jgi:hypothetical protein
MIKNFKVRCCGAIATLGLIGFTAFAAHAVIYTQPLSLIPSLACIGVSLAFGELMARVQARG